MLEFGDGEDGARAEGLLVIKPINARWDLGDPFAVGQEEMGRLPPPRLLLQLLCKGLQIPPYLNNSDKMSVTMATRENKLIQEVSDIPNA